MLPEMVNQAIPCPLAAKLPVRPIMPRRALSKVVETLELMITVKLMIDGDGHDA